MIDNLREKLIFNIEKLADNWSKSKTDYWNTNERDVLFDLKIATDIYDNFSKLSGQEFKKFINSIKNQTLSFEGEEIPLINFMIMGFLYFDYDNKSN